VDKRCIRTRGWKYIHYPSNPYGELYHLARDPHELVNLYERRVEVREQMRAAYYALLDQTEDCCHPRYRRFTGTDPETGEAITHYHTW
jgi:arylsulfatase A-like enzyme